MKPELKFIEKKIISVRDWDDLVEKTYGRPYSFQQQDGCRGGGIFEFDVPSDNFEGEFENDTISPEEINGEEMGVSFKGWLKRNPVEPVKGDDCGHEPWAINLWWHRHFYPCIDMIIKDLHERGVIPEGKYAIVIDL